MPCWPRWPILRSLTRYAGFAGIDPVIMPPPANLDFITGPAVGDLLYADGLAQIPDAGASHGANLLANPTLDLAEPAIGRPS